MTQPFPTIIAGTAALLLGTFSASAQYMPTRTDIVNLLAGISSYRANCVETRVTPALPHTIIENVAVIMKTVGVTDDVDFRNDVLDRMAKIDRAGIWQQRNACQNFFDSMQPKD